MIILRDGMECRQPFPTHQKHFFPRLLYSKILFRGSNFRKKPFTMLAKRLTIWASVTILHVYLLLESIMIWNHMSTANQNKKISKINMPKLKERYSVQSNTPEVNTSSIVDNTRHLKNFSKSKYAYPTQNITNDNHMVKLNLVVYLSGELGNHMFQIAMWKIIQLVALEDGRFNFTMRYVSQGLVKSERTCQEFYKCFSKNLSQDKVNLMEWKRKSPEWRRIVPEQKNFIGSLFQDWKSPAQAAELLTVHSSSMETIRKSLDNIDNVRRRLLRQNELKSPMLEKYQHSLVLPFFAFAKGFLNISLVAKYQNELRELFTFNDSQCCRDYPDVNETVLHIRGFEIENKGIKETAGLRDLDVNRTSNVLLGHLNAGDTVAIVGRFVKVFKNYTEVLRQRGLNVRFMSKQTGPEAFCFIKHAKKEAVGDFHSTFFRTASWLSDTVKNVTFYVNEIPKRGRRKWSTANTAETKMWSRGKVSVHVFDY